MHVRAMSKNKVTVIKSRLLRLYTERM